MTTTDEWIEFTYRDFYDLPRAIVLDYSGTLYMLDCPFDAELDEYPEHYIVYRLPHDLRGVLATINWQDLPVRGERVGQVNIRDVDFDPTRRRAIHSRLFHSLKL